MIDKFLSAILLSVILCQSIYGFPKLVNYFYRNEANVFIKELISPPDMSKSRRLDEMAEAVRRDAMFNKVNENISAEMINVVSDTKGAMIYGIMISSGVTIQYYRR